MFTAKVRHWRADLYLIQKPLRYSAAKELSKGSTMRPKKARLRPLPVSPSVCCLSVGGPAPI